MILFEKDLRGLVWHQNEAPFFSLDTSSSPNADMKEPWLIQDIQLEGEGDWTLIVQDCFGFENTPFELETLRKLVFVPGMLLGFWLDQTSEAPPTSLKILGETLSPARVLELYGAMCKDPTLKSELEYIYSNSSSLSTLADLQTATKAPSKREPR